jgi:transcriptional regulator with XRE-family HTH domain
MEHFADNLNRLLGLHGLSAKEGASILGLSQSALSKWSTGERKPSFPTALTVGEFFHVPADRLARAEFGDLLANELASRDRFEDVEKEISRRRSGLHIVPKPVQTDFRPGQKRKGPPTKGS